MDLTHEQLDAMEKAVAFYSRKFRLENADATHFDVEDLAQEMRLRVWRTLPKMRDTKHFRAFISRSAYFAYARYSQRYKTWRLHVATDVDAEDAVDVRPKGQTPEEAEAIRKAIANAVDSIGDPRDRAICRAYFSGRRRAHIATDFNLSKERVSQVLHESLRPIWLRLRDGDI